MNQLLDTKEYGLGYMDDRTKSLNKNSNANNVGDNIDKESMLMSKILDVNKSLDMSGGAGGSQQ